MLKCSALWVAAAVALGASGIATASTVDLVLSPSSQTVTLGSTVEVDVFAVSADATPDEISVIEAILDWDPGVLTLTGNTDISAGYSWLSSGFPIAGDFGLNASFGDGDAFYVAQSQLFPPSASAPSAPGLLVTTLLFTADALSSGTTVGIPTTDPGSGADTSVIGDTPNFNIFGLSSDARIVVIPEPASLGLLAWGGIVLLTARRRTA